MDYGKTQSMFGKSFAQLTSDHGLLLDVKGLKLPYRIRVIGDLPSFFESVEISRAPKAGTPSVIEKKSSLVYM